MVKCPGQRMRPKVTRARRQRGSCGSSGQKSPTNAWNEPATKAALSGKRTLWSRGGPKPVSSGVSGEIGEAAVDFMQSSAVTASCNQPDAIPRPATPAELDFGIIRGRQEPRCLGRQQNSYLSSEVSTPYLPPRSSSTWTVRSRSPQGIIEGDSRTTLLPATSRRAIELHLPIAHHAYLLSVPIEIRPYVCAALAADEREFIS